MSKIELKHIDKFYGKNHILKDVNLTIEDGDFMTLLGPSGCGKTTTLRVVSGLEKPQNGTIYIDGKEIVNAAEAHFAPPSERGLNLVFQSYALWPHMTVRENIEFGLKIQKLSKAEIENRVKTSLERMQIAQYIDRYPSELSGGQQQRVAIARAIASEPHLLLLDEPLSNLDAKLRVDMRSELKRLHIETGTTMIYVTHDQTEAMTMGTRIVVMKDGFIQQIDTPQNLYDYPTNLFVAGFIGSPQMNFFDATLVREADGVYAVFGNNKILVPNSKVAKFLDEDCIGKEVTMGIRPENMSDSKAFVEANPKSIMEVDVEVVEMLGSETYLYVKTSGKTDNVIARVDPRTTSAAGDKIQLGLETEHLHFFDKETEATLLGR